MTLLQLILGLIFSLVWIGLCFYIVRGSIFSTPFYPSNYKKLKELEDYLKKEGIKNKKFIDLGSGDGRIVFWAANLGFDAYGVDLNPYLTLFSKFKAIFRRNLRVTFLNQNFKKIDFSEYQVVYLYIFREHMAKIKDRLFSELPKNAIIISNVFTFDDVKPNKEIGRFKIYRV